MKKIFILFSLLLFSVCISSMQPKAFVRDIGDIEVEIKMTETTEDKNTESSGNNMFENADAGNSEFQKKDTNSIKKGFNKILKRYKELVTGIMGVVFLTLIGWLIYQFSVFGNYTDNPRMKGVKSTQLLLTFIAIAILGSITLWFSLAFNVFR